MVVRLRSGKAKPRTQHFPNLTPAYFVHEPTRYGFEQQPQYRFTAGLHTSGPTTRETFVRRLASGSAQQEMADTYTRIGLQSLDDIPVRWDLAKQEMMLQEPLPS